MKSTIIAMCVAVFFVQSLNAQTQTAADQEIINLSKEKWAFDGR